MLSTHCFCFLIINAILISSCEDHPENDDQSSIKSSDQSIKTQLNPTSSSNNSSNLTANLGSISTYSETFITDPYIDESNRQKEVDLMFVVDNSASMSDAMENVKLNLENLFNNLHAEASTRIALITKIGTGNLEIQPPAGIPVTTINKDVQSNHSLFYVSDYFTDHISYIQELLLTQASYPPIVLDVPSSDEFFFRKDSLKVFVVVSDDDVSELQAHNFITEVKNIFDPSLQSIMFFGFVYLTGIQNRITNFNAGDVKIHQRDPTTAPCSGSIVTEYYNMLKNNHFLDEALYDICEENWQLNFSNVAENVIEQFNAVRSFLLQKTAISIDSVKVDNQNVDQSKYSLENNRLVFVEEFLQVTSTQTIEVTYSFRTPN